MQRVKKGFVKSGLSVNLNLNVDNGPLGVGEELDRYAQEELKKAINPVQDMELVRFKPLGTMDMKIYPFFTAGVDTANSFLNAGFTKSKVVVLSPSFLNSLFIFEVFDKTDQESQTRLSVNYAKCDSTNVYEEVIAGNRVMDRTPRLVFKPKMIQTEFNVVYLPKYFLTGDNQTVYMRVSFFCALTGKIIRFKMGVGGGEEKVYLPILIDNVNKQYDFTNTSPITITQVVFEGDNAPELRNYDLKPFIVMKRGVGSDFGYVGNDDSDYPN